MSKTGRLRGLCAWAVLGVLAAASASAQEDYIAQANAFYAGISPGKRSDLVLLPALAEMDEPPGVVATPRQAMLFAEGDEGWEEVAEWAQAPAQRAVLDALTTVTAEKDPNRGMAFAQPYGQDAGYEALSTGLYTSLGAPPLLAAAEFLYLPALDDMASLVHVEATRLASEGSPMGAIELLLDWLFFARQIADREMFDEARWGYLTMIDTLQRVRDIVYIDAQRSTAFLTASDLKAILAWNDDRGSYLEIERLNFPRAERIAFEQLLDVVYTKGPNGAPNPATFASTMARLSAKERPLQLFSATAWWRDAASSQASYFAMRDEGAGCYVDWAQNRWPRDYHEPFLREPSHFETLDPAHFAILRTLCTRQSPGGAVNLGILEHARQRVLTEIVGTRTALAVAAYIKANNRFPPVISSLVPEYLGRLQADPYNPDRSRGARPPLEYFVPWTINDRRPTERDIVRPHEINVVLGSGLNFRSLVETDEFVLYSVGPNGGSGKARYVQNTSELNPGDYLIWPPVLSLHRQYLSEQGQ